MKRRGKKKTVITERTACTKQEKKMTMTVRMERGREREGQKETNGDRERK